MKMKLTKILAVVGLFVAAGGMSHAATFDLADGGMLCEGPNSLLPPSVGCDASNTFGDGGQTSGPDVNLTFGNGVGSAMIFGGVRGKNDNTFADVFTIKGSGSYKLTLSSIRILDANGVLLDPVSAFDASWSMGAPVGTISNVVDPAVLQLSTVVDLTNPTTFNLNAAGGLAADGSYMEYKVTIAAVPLPASALFLLGGIGGLVAMRRRKKKAA